MSYPPDFAITVYGNPAPQGSKRHVGGGRMIESSKAVVPWRQDVRAAALAEVEAEGLELLDGPLSVSMTFTVRHQPASKPTWWPAGTPWKKTMRWRPASAPDLSKLVRATEDALTGIAWKDDARVVEYVRLAKFYVGDDELYVLPHSPGAVIRVWSLGAG